MQVYAFFLDKIYKLLTYYTPFYHQGYQLSKTVCLFFGSPFTYL